MSRRGASPAAAFYLVHTILLVVLLLLPATSPQLTLEELCSSLYDSDSFDVTHLVADHDSSRVYAAAVNRLFQLSEDLEVLHEVVTGPEDDNPVCPPPPEACQCTVNCKDTERHATDSHTKSLVIDHTGGHLIHCTNLFQGHCVKYGLNSFSAASDSTQRTQWTLIVPNDVSSSVVMFVAPGPHTPPLTASGSGPNILYVAATRSLLGLPAYNDLIPTVCMRNINDFSWFSDDFLTPSKVYIESQQRDTFRVNYIYGFSSLNFSYFLTVQPAATDSPDAPVSRIVRICQRNPALAYTYAEVPVECRSRGTVYGVLRAATVVHVGARLARHLGLADVAPATDHEHVLVAVFTTAAGQVASLTASTSAAALNGTASALCVYPVLQIRRKFTETIQKCFQGVGNTGPAHIIAPQACIQTPFDIGDNYCGENDMNHPIHGTDPVTREASLTWTGAPVTSLAVTTTDTHTVAFIGTQAGQLKKVLIEPDDVAVEYWSKAVNSRTPINQAMVFDRLHENIYLTSHTKILRIPVQQCSTYTTCSECLQSKDPYCGWCTLESRCSLKSECRNSEAKSRWLPYNYDSCPRIALVEPRHVQKLSSDTSTIRLTVQSLPVSANSTYECVFTGFGVSRITSVFNVSPANSINTTLLCTTPASNLLPPFPTGKDHIDLTLAVRLPGTQDFLFTNFTFYDCGVHTSCTKCTDSDYPCKWCIKQHRCTNHATSGELCLRDVMVTGKQLPGNTDNPGPETCPRIENTVTSSEILISSGKTRNVTVKAVNLQNFQREFKCHFNFDGGVEAPGELVFGDGGLQQYIQCHQVLFSYPGPTSLMNVPFSIQWLNGDEYSPLDNPTSLQVRMFKCSAMASNCGGCRRTDAVYECGWDASSLQCCVRDECRGPSWLSTNEICTNPTVLSVSPLSGPRAGGTSVTITGENLGSGATDSVINMAGVPCLITGFDPFISYVCVTRPALGESAALSGRVVVTIGSQDQALTAESEDEFSFADPKVTAFWPSVGPMSGGTKLTISGTNLDIGSHVTVTLSNDTAEVPCVPTGSRSTDFIVCVTDASVAPCIMNTLLVNIDLARINFTEQLFEVTPDPVIESFSPHQSIVSGGIVQTVRGNFFTSVADPQLVVYFNNRQFAGRCVVSNQTLMYCRTPDLRFSGLVRNSSLASHVTVLHYGFIMDNVLSVRNMSHITDFLNVFPDPEFDGFTDGVKQMFLPRNDYHLIINGRHLNLVLSEQDLLVMIGSQECEVTSLSATQLTCKPTYSDTDNSEVTAGGSVLVVVTLKTSHNISHVIGELKYEGAAVFTFSLTVILALAGGALLVVIIIVCVLVAYRRKSRESTQVMKRMQNQMDVLEIRVAKECKEAFAELQTDMNEIAGEISGSGGIPYRCYRSFCMSVLFPGFPQNAHPVVQMFNCDESTARGLQQFSHLLGVKTFLLLFIRTLEQDKEFHMRDKVNVASLLSVVLQGRMEYHTDILKTLLAELIERAMEVHNHPKLLLRRTDSVAEKMLTNWFTFLLYKFLKDCSGEPLFMLFRALKQQIDKGPVDMVTGEARYSLSEDKLIRQQIEYKQMTVKVTDPEGEQEHCVRVLDCDTITQVKEKILDAIYRNTPFSHRPTKEELDLEWHTGVRSRYILKDEDVTTRSESGFKRLNTLAHYKVTDGTLLALIPRQTSTSIYDLSNVSEKSSFQHRYEEYFSGSPASLTRSLSPNAVNVDLDSGSRSYHLVKPQDADSHKDCERGNKMVSEVYLTRLLTTKVTVQQFVDDLFETIFSTANRECTLPLAVKYMFDFLDDQALLHGITDPEVVHTWKSNILPLRFWVNVVKNPDFVFDVHKSNIVDSCLSVVAQTFMDSCSMSEHKLSKDSPSSKLLYAKDIPKYRKWVERYYQDIQTMPAISDQDMNAMLAEESRLHQHEFTVNAALYQLFQYADRYFDTLMDDLENDEFARNYHLSSRLQQVHAAMHPRV